MSRSRRIIVKRSTFWADAKVGKSEYLCESLDGMVLAGGNVFDIGAGGGGRGETVSGNEST